MGQGQHYIQAALIGKEYSQNKNKHSRNNKISIIPIKKLENYSDKDINETIFKNILEVASAENIFTENYLDSQIEKSILVGEIEKIFYHTTEETLFSNMINHLKEKENTIFSEKDYLDGFSNQFKTINNSNLFNSYVAMNEARNIQTYCFMISKIKSIKEKFINIKKEEISNDFFFMIHNLQKEFFFSSCNSFTDTIKISSSLQKILNSNSQEEKEVLNLLFNYIYPKYWENFEQKLNSKHLLIFNANRNFFIGTNLVIDLGKPFYKNITEQVYFQNLVKLGFEKILSTLIIFILKDKLYLYFNNQEDAKSFEENIKNRKFLLSFFYLLSVIQIVSSYKNLIIPHDESDFLLKNINELKHLIIQNNNFYETILS